jgi:glycosyltransferase involved in cell wall biosynthesis
MNNILVSIIVPVYNTEEYLSKCIESLINQTYENIEIICVNDGSNDNSLIILKEYAQKDTRIKIINQENKGVSYSRNIGIEKATGDYILFIDSDDWYERIAIEEIIKQLQNTDYDIVYFNVICVNKNFYKKKNVTKKICIDKKRTYNNDGVHCFCFNRNFLNTYNIRFEEALKISEDNLFQISCFINATKISLLDKYLYYYLTQREGSVTQNLNLFLENQFYSYLYITNRKFFKNLSDLNKLYITDLWGFYLFATWLKYPIFSSKNNKFIIQFLEFYKQYNNVKIYKFYGYYLLKYRIICRISYSLINKIKIFLKLFQNKMRKA